MSPVPVDVRRGLRSPRIRLGASAWLGTVQFFVAEAVVQSRWTLPYSRRDNYVSDLGALHCPESVDDRLVCSPWHTVMNTSFVLQGLLIATGAVLLHRLWRPRSTSVLAIATTALLVTAGAGVAVVGLAPEDTVGALHLAGAAANFAAGSAGLVGLYFVGQDVPRVQTAVVWAGLLGVIGLLALATLVTGADWGLGPGGIERVVAYAIPLALPVVAVGALRGRQGKMTPGLEASSTDHLHG